MTIIQDPDIPTAFIVASVGRCAMQKFRFNKGSQRRVIVLNYDSQAAIFYVCILANFLSGQLQSINITKLIQLSQRIQNFLKNLETFPVLLSGCFQVRLRCNSISLLQFNFYILEYMPVTNFLQKYTWRPCKSYTSLPLCYCKAVSV